MTAELESLTCGPYGGDQVDPDSNETPEWHGVALADEDHYNDLIQRIKDVWIPAFQAMTTQFTTTMMDQVLAIGMLIDAKEQLEAERLMQKKAAEAHKAYRADLELCQFGTGIRSLAASERVSLANTIHMNRILNDRERMAESAISGTGRALDMQTRLAKFKTTYCEVISAETQLGLQCAYLWPWIPASEPE
jgi:hypothetical protein